VYFNHNYEQTQLLVIARCGPKIESLMNENLEDWLLAVTGEEECDEKVR